MSQIFTGISDWDLDKEFIQNIKDRSIDQKFLYLEDGATNYYNYYEAVKKRVGLLQDVFTDEDYFTFWQKNIYTHQTKEAYIALACGQAKIDLAVVNKISSKVDDYTLLGVDSSYSMLESARNNYFESESAFQAKFLCIDFSRIDFPEKIESYTDPFDKKVFSLLWGTIGNIPPTNIVDTLYNMMEKDDILWFDVLARKSLAKNMDLSIFWNYTERIHDDLWRDFVLYPLQKAWIDISKGKLVLTTSPEDSAWVLKCSYKFEITQPITASYKKTRFHCLPPESIHLLTIRLYHPPTMIQFFESHGFELISDQTKGSYAQFAFRKK